MHNHDVIFDNDNKRIGLVSSKCEMDNEFVQQNPVTKPEIDYKFKNTCSNDIRFLRNICLAVTITMICIISILVYIISELRKSGRFMWISLGEDIGKLENKIFI